MTETNGGKVGLRVILAADVVGFSRLIGADEDRTLARLELLRLSRNPDEFRGLPCLVPTSSKPSPPSPPAQSPLCPKKRIREPKPRDGELLELLPRSGPS